MCILGKTYGLKVNRVRKSEDEGTYSVVASNSFGKCEASCTLGIIGKYKTISRVQRLERVIFETDSLMIYSASFVSL